MDRHEETLTDLTRAVELSSESENFYQRRAEILRSTGRHDEALDDFTNALELLSGSIEAAPENASHHFDKGHLLFGLDPIEEAVLECLEVIRLLPRDVFNPHGHIRRHWRADGQVATMVHVPP
jgi:tetratricopeptide (TPR) repeat protein